MCELHGTAVRATTCPIRCNSKKCSPPHLQLLLGDVPAHHCRLEGVVGGRKDCSRVQRRRVGSIVEIRPDRLPPLEYACTGNTPLIPCMYLPHGLHAAWLHCAQLCSTRSITCPGMQCHTPCSMSSLHVTPARSLVTTRPGMEVSPLCLSALANITSCGVATISLEMEGRLGCASARVQARWAALG